METSALIKFPLLKENIFFLIAGVFTSAVSILFFDARLYSEGEVFLLFIVVFISFLVQAFATRNKIFITRGNFALFFLQSGATHLAFLSLLYLFILPFTFDFVFTLKLGLFVTFIETGLAFFIRYKRQYILLQQKENVISQIVKQQQVKELEVLKQQIDPHFIFNSFNTLAYLIDENRDKAKQFSNKLANVHRYIIFNSNKNLVSLADEAAFAKDYAYLQEIRHSNEVQIRFSGFDHVDDIFILPVSIQVLIENAIKHNSFSETQALEVSVAYEHGHVCVINKLTNNQKAVSTKIGLSNLRDRYSLILGKDIQIIKTDIYFKVLLPVLNK